MSSGLREEKRKKKKMTETDNELLLSWQDKKARADQEGENLAKELEHFKTWINMIEAMKDEDLREYLENRPEELKTVKISKSKPKKRVQKNGSSESSTSKGIMASVWKFHKEETEGEVYC